MKRQTYQQCLKEAADNKSLKLCPRGYCTARQKFKVYPSAYANGYASQVCNGTKPDFTGKTKRDYPSVNKPKSSDLSRWYREKWVNVCAKDQQGKYLPCGRDEAKLTSQNYPYCRPLKKLPGTKVKTVNQLTEQELKQMCQRKSSIKPGVDGKPTRVFVSDLYLDNPKTGRKVKASGRIGKQLVGGAQILPNMALVQEYNKFKSKQTKAKFKGRNVTLYAPELSGRATKKLKVYVKDPDTNQIKEVHFGHPDYQDYTTHRDEERRKNYCSRTGGIRCDGKECGVTSANYWSRMALWNC